MNILGINTGHDSGATLLHGSEIIAINEERLSRVKLHNGFPSLAIAEVMRIAELTPSDIDSIVVEGKHITPQSDIGFDELTGDWKKALLNKLGADKFLLGSETGLKVARMILAPRTLNAHSKVASILNNMEFQIKPSFIDHHLCHAASAYLSQGRNAGMAVTLDASGEGYCSRVYLCQDNKMNLVHQIPCYHSPAYYYSYITKILGFKPMRHEGKITGLAAFGSWKESYPILSSFIHFDKRTCSFVNQGGYHIKVISKLEKSLADYSQEDIAAGIQKLTEELVCAYILELISRYCQGGNPHLFLSGGIFANVKINQRIDELDAVKSTYIFPNMGDGGLNVGAALHQQNKQNHKRFTKAISTVYWGKHYTDEDNKKALTEAGIQIVKKDNIEAEIARSIYKKKIVCRFNEAMEYGPRALGNRSIIYEAGDHNLNVWLNEKLGRTEFMPFAPFVRDIDAAEYFAIEGASMTPFNFMTMTCNVTKKCIDEAPAVVHVDQTARPQIINAQDHKSLYKILTVYKELSGIGVLVNTSFNLHEEPIVNTPQEAIATFQRSNLHTLALGNYLIENSA